MLSHSTTTWAIAAAGAMLLLAALVVSANAGASHQSGYFSVHYPPGMLCGAIAGLITGVGCAALARPFLCIATPYLIALAITASVAWRGSPIWDQWVIWGFFAWGTLPFTGVFAIVAFIVWAVVSAARRYCSAPP